MAEWIKSGVLDSVDQIGMEMHTGRVHVKPESHVRVLRDLIGYFQGRRQRGICIQVLLSNQLFIYFVKTVNTEFKTSWLKQ